MKSYAYANCSWCHGRGCNQCMTERDKAIKKFGLKAVGGGKETYCIRCKARCTVTGPGKADAKMLRYSKTPQGLCVNCAAHDWLRNTYPVNMMLAKSGPAALAHVHIRAQFAEIMRVGNADADPNEINWNLLSDNWDLPFPHKIKPSATNPCSQRELDEITEGKRKGFGEFEPPKPDPLKGKTVISSFEELNLLKPGLGDQFKQALDGHAGRQKKGMTDGNEDTVDE